MERRAYERVSTEVDVQARVGGRLGRVTVSDLSVQGCRIVTTNGFVSPGDAIILIFDNVRMVGQVIWQEGRDAGVEFRTQMHAAVVAHLGFEQEARVQQRVSLSNCVKRTMPFHSRTGTLSDLPDVLAFFGPSGVQHQGSEG